MSTARNAAMFGWTLGGGPDLHLSRFAEHGAAGPVRVSVMVPVTPVGGSSASRRGEDARVDRDLRKILRPPSRRTTAERRRWRRTTAEGSLTPAASIPPIQRAHRAEGPGAGT